MKMKIGLIMIVWKKCLMVNIRMNKVKGNSNKQSKIILEFDIIPYDMFVNNPGLFEPPLACLMII